MDEQDNMPEENKGTKIAISDVNDAPAPAREESSVERPVVNDITPPPAPTQDNEKSDDVAEPTETELTPEASGEVAAAVENLQPETQSEDPVEETSETESSDTLAEAPVEQTDEEVSEKVTSVLGSESAQPEQTDQPQEVKTLEAIESNEETSTLPDGDMATVGMAASQMNKPPHRNNKKLAAIVTVFAALVLAGVAVFLYFSANTNTKENTTSVNPASESTERGQAPAPVAPATTADVDATNTAVDEALNSLDEAADFADADLSDTSLGL